MRSISKQHMVDGISGRLEMSKIDVERVMNAFIDEIKDCFRKGKRVEVHGFGTFFPQKKKARNVVVPSTGKKHEVRARTMLKFKTSKQMCIFEE